VRLYLILALGVGLTGYALWKIRDAIQAPRVTDRWLDEQERYDATRGIDQVSFQGKFANREIA
jgi:hypothetical protein